MRISRVIAVLLAVAALPLALSAQPARGLKVLLLYDMEGITAADEYRKTTFAHPAQYAEGRRSLTADVNAAIAGLEAGGATEIVVVDGHGSGNSQEPDILVDQMAAPAVMHFRSTPFDISWTATTTPSTPSSPSACTPGRATGPGSWPTPTAPTTSMRVNGTPFNETMILAMGAARLRIPVVMVSGDDQLERELRRFLPWAKCAAVSTR